MIQLLRDLAISLAAKAFMDALDNRFRAIAMAEHAELYVQLVQVEECVTLLGARLNRMQDGLRVLGDETASTPQENA